MDEVAIRRAKERLYEASQKRAEPADVNAALDRARTQLESLAELTAQIEATLPGQVEDAVREGVRAEALPIGRQLAEVRGLSGQTIRRLERLEHDLLAERHARIDDLALLVDLITSGWKGVDQRLARLERKVETGQNGPAVYRIEEREPLSSWPRESRPQSQPTG
ncbi:MAG TPA: hypothetical protein VFL41_08255 [Gaiellaceae bacterium]|nr:hypothetical protein [Gaiellaceae bacterium]